MLARLLFCAGGFGNTASVVLLVNMRHWILAQEFAYKLERSLNQKTFTIPSKFDGKKRGKARRSMIK